MSLFCETVVYVVYMDDDNQPHSCRYEDVFLLFTVTCMYLVVGNCITLVLLTSSSLHNPSNFHLTRRLISQRGERERARERESVCLCVCVCTPNLKTSVLVASTCLIS